MARVRFSSGEQQKFLNSVHKKSQLSWGNLGLVLGISGRTLRDWRIEKYTASHKALLQLSKKFNVKLPKKKEILDDYWYVFKGAREGALRRNELYGPLGTLESRRKGGKVSQERRRRDPEYYRKLGCKIRNKFKKPRRSQKLAELVGIILGDGSITNFQVTVSLNNKDDKKYALFVCKLIEDLFGYNPAVSDYKYKNTLVVRVSGVNFVIFLESLGLKRGNKIKNDIKVPRWIEKDIKFSLACLRGLFDTDGCIYFHKHWTKGIQYRNLGWNFASHSPKLISFVKETLVKYQFAVKLSKKTSLYMYDLREIERYFKKIGTNNPKHYNKFKNHLSESRRIS